MMVRFFKSLARREILFLLGVIVWLLVPAGIRPLSVPDEGRYADVARWMLVSGDWLTPRLDGLPFFHKPPLLYWLEGSLFAVFGVHAWVARVVPAFAAMILCFTTYFFTRQHLGRERAERATLILASSLLVFGGAQYVNHDTLVAAWISATIALFASGVIDGDKRRIRWGFVTCALGVMTKGLIGIVLPGIVLLPWLLLSGRARQILFLLDIPGILLWAVLALPWFGLMQAKYPAFFDYFFMEQHFRRYTATGTFNNVHPWWSYLVWLPAGFLPWVLLPSKTGFIEGHRATPRDLTLLFACWLVAITLFFSATASKIVGYIMPAVIPLALWLELSTPRDAGAIRKALVGLCPILTSLGLLWFLVAKHHVEPDAVGLIKATIAALLLLGTGVAFSLINDRLDLLRATALVAAGWGITFTIIAGQADPRSSAKDLAALQALKAPEADLVFYHDYWYDLPFLLDHRKPVIAIEHWTDVTEDSWRKELFDGVRFDTEAAKVLWSNDQLEHALRTGRPLLIVARTKDLARDDVPATLKAMTPALKGKHFTAFVSGAASTQQ